VTAGNDFDVIVGDARRSLSNPRPFVEVEQEVPDCPGLYAVHADTDTWIDLGLGEPPDRRPRYIGKAEDSLVSRDLKTHFGDGRLDPPLSVAHSPHYCVRSSD
jgi:hypothetical protein